MGHELDALGFAAAKRRTGLAKLQITQTGVTKRLKWPFNFGNAGEEIHCFIDGQFEDLGNILAAEFDVQRFAIESCAATNLAAHKSRGQEIHLQLDRTRTFAFGTAALGAVEGKST